MIPLLTASETAASDREAEERGTSVATLMERGGLAVARAASAVAAGSYGRRAVVVAGKGNNGGDGLVAARHLARWGMAVDVILLADPADLRAPAGEKLTELRRGGTGVRTFERSRLVAALTRADVAIDAIVGTGFRDEPEGDHRAAIEALNECAAPVVAVDVPSGVEGDTGAVRGVAVHADVTVALAAPKIGDVLLPGGAHAGQLEVADIGIPQELLRADIALVEATDVAAWLPVRPPQAHKRSTGVVLVVAGSKHMTGAPRLVAHGALRAGAGLVTIAVPEPVLTVVQTGSEEPTFLGLPVSGDGSLGEEAWEVIEPQLDRFDAVAIGPGLSEAGGALARMLVVRSPVPVVADADSINAFAGRPADLASRRAAGVITPHAGEFARLFGMPVAELEEDRVGLVRKAAAETEGIVVLKGPHTLVGSQEGEVRVNPTGGPELATGGTGDVLAGTVAGLIARGLEPLIAASAGAYLHGLAGEIAATRTGHGTLAHEVAAALPEAAARIRGAS